MGSVNTGGITATGDLAALTPDVAYINTYAISALSLDAISKLTTAGTEAWTSNEIAALTTSQINSMTTTELGNWSPGQVQALTAAQIGQ